MAKISIAIVDADDRYMQGVSDYFNNNYSERFTVSCFSSKEYLLELLNTKKKFDIVVINKDMYFEELTSYNIKTKVIFSDFEEQGEIDGYPIINKYISGQALHDNLIKAYTEQNSDELEKLSVTNTESKIITVYSPIGGIGKTTVAVNLAKELASNGNSVLYLNLEDVQTTDLYFNSIKETTLSDLIFAVKEKKKDIKGDIVSFVSKDDNSGVYFYKSIDSMLDIEDMDKKDVKVLLENLIEVQMFNTIIVDTSSKYNLQYRVLLNNSDEIIVPFGMDNVSTEKLNIFINNVTDLEKYTFLINKSINNPEYMVPEVLQRENKSVEGGIPYDINMQFNDAMESNANMVMKQVLQSLIVKFNLV
jgi:cellulose biosynthesis protein BcsQ